MPQTATQFMNTPEPSASADASGVARLHLLLDEIAATTSSVSRQTLSLGLGSLVRSADKDSLELMPVDDFIELLIAETDARISEQMNEIMHDARFMELERAWRSLAFLVRRIPSEAPVRVQYISVSKEDLLADFEDNTEILTSGLYFHIYIRQYGQFGGKPIGAIIGNYEFSASAPDIRLLRTIASIASMAHAPFIAAADKSFFGISSWNQLPNINDLHYHFEMPRFASWNSFRASDDARYTALTLPRFLLRAPYGADSPSVTSFLFNENTDDTATMCWGNASFALAYRLAASFSAHHWCVNITGQDDGAVPDLPTYSYDSMNSLQMKIPTEVLISEQLEDDLSKLGFVSLTMLKGANTCAFFSVNSCQRPISKSPELSDDYVLSYNISRQLPYMFLITRLAHYIKIIQREYIGSWKTAKELERELNTWLAQYVTTMSDPDLRTRSRRPFNYGKIRVTDSDTTVGWYTVYVEVRPHFRYMGMSFTLSLTGKLDK